MSDLIELLIYITGFVIAIVILIVLPACLVINHYNRIGCIETAHTMNLPYVWSIGEGCYIKQKGHWLNIDNNSTNNVVISN